MTRLTWVKCEGGDWCHLERVDLAGVTVTGVYIIWHGGRPSRVVRIGRGDIAARLTEERQDPEILGQKWQGDLYVTWAAVPPAQLDGVQRYLSEMWKPLLASRLPDSPAISVNSPFG